MNDSSPPQSALASASAAHFRSKLAHETDGADVWTELRDGSASFVLLDTRSVVAWEQGHAEGAVHIPTAELADRVPAEFPNGTEFVVYCWSPGCNGADKAALILSELGHPVKIMIGGFEYWAREGYPIETAAGSERHLPDPLVSPVRVSQTVSTTA